jgi:hypothetical protein
MAIVDAAKGPLRISIHSTRAAILRIGRCWGPA